MEEATEVSGFLGSFIIIGLPMRSGVDEVVVVEIVGGVVLAMTGVVLATTGFSAGWGSSFFGSGFVAGLGAGLGALDTSNVSSFFQSGVG